MSDVECLYQAGGMSGANVVLHVEEHLVSRD